MLLVSLFALSLTNCVSIPNGPGCVELREDRGWCTMTLTDQEFFVDDQNLYKGKNWHQLKVTSVFLPNDYFAELKAVLLKQCKKNNNCPQFTEFKIWTAEQFLKRNEYLYFQGH